MEVWYLGEGFRLDKNCGSFYNYLIGMYLVFIMFLILYYRYSGE